MRKLNLDPRSVTTPPSDSMRSKNKDEVLEHNPKIVKMVQFSTHGKTQCMEHGRGYLLTKRLRVDTFPSEIDDSVEFSEEKDDQGVIVHHTDADRRNQYLSKVQEIKNKKQQDERYKQEKKQRAKAIAKAKGKLSDTNADLGHGYQIRSSSRVDQYADENSGDEMDHESDRKSDRGLHKATTPRLNHEAFESFDTRQHEIKSLIINPSMEASLEEDSRPARDTIKL